MFKDKSNLAFNIFLLLAPFLIVYFLVHVIFGKNFTDFIPVSADGRAYWHEIATFVEAGFNGGYYSIDEHIAPLSFSHFGPHGPMVPVLFGIMSKFLGWEIYSAPIYNIVIFTASLFVFKALVKPEKRHIPYLIWFILTVYSVYWMATTNLMEVLNQSFAVVLAGIFTVLLRDNGNCSKKFKIWSFIFIIFISLFRYSWAVISLPFFLLIIRDPKVKDFIKSTVAAVFLTFLMLKISNLWTSMTYSFFTDIFSANPIDAFEIIFTRLLRNIEVLFAARVPPMVHGLTWPYMLLIILLLIFELRYIFRDRIQSASTDNEAMVTTRKERFLHLYFLAPVFLLNLFLYDMSWSIYRVIAPYFIISMLVLIIMNRTKLVTLFLVINMFMMPTFLMMIKNYRSTHYLGTKNTHFYEVQKQLSRVFVFDKSTRNPWCNTILTSLDVFSTTAISPGIGISYLRNLSIVDERKLKSKYIVLDDKSYAAIKDKANLQLLGKTIVGLVSINKDADCP